MNKERQRNKRMQGSIKIEAGEKRLADLTTSMKMWKNVHWKDRDSYCEAEEVDSGKEGNSWVETRNKENRADGWGKKRAGEGNYA